jgi:uncharacterized membrane protein (DUF441 family)
MNETRNRDRIGWALLTLSFGIGCLTINRGFFVDEADNLVLGWLISEGDVLYRDVFSHHFPFPYYWVAGMIGLFGKSIFLIRLSVWVFQISAIGIAMSLTGYRLSLGLTALIWSILRPLYMGNLVLYDAFCAASLAAVFSITISILTRRRAAGRCRLAAIGAFSTIAILSNPLSVYAVLILLVCLLGHDWKEGFIASSIVGAGVLSYGGYLLASGTFDDFWKDTIVFNLQVYSGYASVNAFPVRRILRLTLRGLGIANSAWMDFDPFKTIDTASREFDRWAFTGFLFRFSVLANVVILAFRKHFRAAIFLYLFTAASLVIYKWGFHSQPFVMISLIAVSTTITGEWSFGETSRALKSWYTIAGVFVGIIVIWLSIRVVTYSFVGPTPNLRHTPFGAFEKEGARIKSLTCKQPDVLLAAYPGDTYLYWFADMKPVSKYVFMWPWVAETGLPEVIEQLSRRDILAVVLLRDVIVADRYQSRVYLQPLVTFLANNYLQVSKGYLSHELSRRCRAVGSAPEGAQSSPE